MDVMLRGAGSVFAWANGASISAFSAGDSFDILQSNGERVSHEESDTMDYAQAFS